MDEWYRVGSTGPKSARCRTPNSSALCRIHSYEDTYVSCSSGPYPFAPNDPGPHISRYWRLYSPCIFGPLRRPPNIGAQRVVSQNSIDNLPSVKKKKKKKNKWNDERKRSSEAQRLKSIPRTWPLSQRNSCRWLLCAHAEQSLIQLDPNISTSGGHTSGFLEGYLYSLFS